MKYWDSSALVALIVEESTSAERRALLRQDHRIVTWWGSGIECASAVNWLHREGGMDRTELGQSLEQLKALAATWLEVRPLERVRRRALRLLRVHPLRSADALQLAAALTAADEDPTSLDIVSSDARLSTAAQMEGFRAV